MKDSPYQYGWTRQLFHEFLINQAVNFGINSFTVKEACYDQRWNPVIEFNGCNLVQDKLHPFLPCFLHDWRWVTGQGGYKSDVEFYNNLRKAGMPKFEATSWFVAVRIGWLFYYKWKKKNA